jgi:uncharacterized protein
MAGTSLLLLLDDIATIMDDVAVMTKIAAKKTTGVLGDDLALNAEQVSGVRAERELPVVWAVCKGSFKNKLILVPAALAISWAMPWLIAPLLMLGGLYLCLEGFEKIAHRFLHSKQEDAAEHAKLTAALLEPELDMVAFEEKKIKGAIRTDFVLSAEIIVIALGSTGNAPFLTQVLVISSIALLMTVGVYSLVAGIVRLDDAGLYLSKQVGDGLHVKLARLMGKICLLGAPLLMKALTMIGTVAMFMVGGGIISHGIPPLHHWFDAVILSLSASLGIGPLFSVIFGTLLDAGIGLVAGALALLGVTLGTKIYQGIKK